MTITLTRELLEKTQEHLETYYDIFLLNELSQNESEDVVKFYNEERASVESILDFFDNLLRTL